VVHPLAPLLDGVAHGRFPDPDGAVHALPALPHGIDALVAFTGTFVVTGGLDQAEVDARVPRDEFRIPTSVPFLSWIGDALGARLGTQDIVFVTRSPGEPPEPIHSVELVEQVASDHPRVAEARRHRRGVRVYETEDGRGVVVLGRGLTNRWEVAYEIDPDARDVGLGRALLLSAVRTLPHGTPVWAQVAPGNAASVRGVIAAGFRPVAAEILLVRDGR
jgi:hypothetical protein